MHTVTVLLTRYYDFWGRLICFLSHSEFSHASVSLDGSDEFYSFNYHGFVIEHPKKKKKISLAITFEVTDREFDIIDSEIKRFRDNRSDYKYTIAGLLLCMMRIPHKFKNRYICSQFVAEVLSYSGAATLKKSPSLYLPVHLKDGLNYQHPVNIQKQVLTSDLV